MAIISADQFFGGKPGRVVQAATANPSPTQSKPASSFMSKVKGSAIDAAKGYITGGIPGAFQGAAKDISDKFLGEVVPEVVDSAKKRFSDVKGAYQREKAGDTNEFQTGLNIAGNAVGLVTDAAGAVASTVFKHTVPQSVREKVLENPIVQKGLDLASKGMEKYTSWKKEHPEAASDLESVINLGSIIPLGEGARVGIKGAENLIEGTAKIGSKVAEQGIDAVKSATGGVLETGSKAIEAGRDVASGLGDAAKMAIKETKRIPSRIATNVAEKKLVQETIDSLPTETARKAAQDGVSVADINTVFDTANKGDKALSRELARTARDFSKGVSNVDPIEVVGRPINARIKQLESARGTIGQKLGEIAKNLGVVTKEEVTAPVFDSLKGVPGLNGLTVNKNGVLNFKNTVLTSSETAADRKAIQSIYSQATKWGNGSAKHRLRQELFEILGGKKRSLSALTDTQEKAYEAIRKGLSDVLEAKNPEYKILSNEYRKVVQPLQDIRKFMKNVAGADEDILDMNAGLLARRLTSFSKSNPEVRALLRSLDSATKAGGDTAQSVEKLQDLYNVLDRYYDISGGTSFQGQTKNALGKGGGVVDRLSDAVGSMAGETPAVRQKALEDLFTELFK